MALRRRPPWMHNVNRIPKGTVYSDRARAASYLEKVDDKRLGFDEEFLALAITLTAHPLGA
jgi:hypothetical protein